MKRKYSFEKKLRYELDDFISKGLWAQLLLLFGCGLILVVVFGIIIRLIFGGESLSWSMWQSLMHIIDQGTITGEESEDSHYLIIMLIITIIGMAFTSAIIGIMGNAVQEKIDELKKGHSAIIEKNHVVILGFNENTLTIANEVIEIQKTKKGKLHMVIVDDIPKDEMEHIAKEVSWSNRKPGDETLSDPNKDSQIISIFRSGDLVSENTFSICAVDRAKTIIVNGNDDCETIRILMGLSAYLKKCNAYIGDEHMPVVTALIHKLANVETARLAAGITDDGEESEKKESRLKILSYRDIMAKLFIHACLENQKTGEGSLGMRNFIIIGNPESLPKIVEGMKRFSKMEINVDVLNEDPYNWVHVREVLEGRPYLFDINDDRRLTNILILSPSGETKEEADNKVMMLLLNLRHYLKDKRNGINITAEMNLPMNQALVMTDDPHDHVISTQAANRLMVQMAEE